MFKYKFHIIQLKKIIPSLILLLFIIGLMLFSNTNLMAAKKGLTLWANSIVPSLFPFFVATELLSKTNFVYFIGRFFNNIMYETSFQYIWRRKFCFNYGITQWISCWCENSNKFQKK